MATETVTASFGNMAAPYLSTEEFDSVAIHTLTGQIRTWTNPTYGLTNPSTYANVPFSIDDEGISKALDFTRDFVTDFSIPPTATITYLRPRVYAYYGGMLHAVYYVNIIGSETEQFTLNKFSTNPYIAYPNAGEVSGDWGISNAQAIAFLDGTNPLRLWARDTSNTLAVSARCYYVVMTAEWTYESTLATAEGALPIGMFNY